MRDYSFNYSRISKIPGKRKKEFKFYIFLGIIFLVLVYTISRLIINPIDKPEIAAISHPSPAPTNIKQINTYNDRLTDRIQKIIDSSRGTYSVYIKDLKTGEEADINGEMVITAASVNKIPILAAVYKLASDGKIDLEKIVVPQPSDIQNYGTGSIRYDPPNTPYSLKTLSRLMVQKSDNTAAFILANYTVGLDNIQKMINIWGMEQTDINENKSSVKDISIIMEKIKSGEIAGKALTSEMLSFMSKTDFDDRIPKGLPEGTKYYHKTGDEVGKIHDAGIVDTGQKQYYIGVFTLDITNEEEAKNKIAEISKSTFEYFKSKN